MKLKSKDGRLVAEAEIDNTLLQEKLDLLFDFKSVLFKGISDKFISESFGLVLNSAIDDNNVLLDDFVVATWTDGPEKFTYIFDFNITNFIRKWIVTMRAHDSNSFCLIHSGSSVCRGNKS